MSGAHPDPRAIALRPNRIPWPPLLYGAAVVAGLGLGWLVPLEWPAPLNGAVVRLVGGVVLLLGLGLDLWALATLYRAHTNVLPNRAADHLVTTGPFAFSRNPIYVGNTLAVLGLGLALLNLWLMAASVLAAVATDRLAARREEAHLQARFGAAFEAYRARVSRWILW